MAFHNPFTDEEMDAAAAVPMTDDILLHALRIGTGSLGKFADEIMKPILDGLIGWTDRDKAIGMTFYRLLAGLKTCNKLTDPFDFQTTAGTTRTIFELCVDLILLTDNLIVDGVDKFHAFTRAARFSAAYLSVQFYEAHPELKDDDTAAERYRLVQTPGLQTEIESLCKRLWNKHKAPEHWSGLRWSEQVELLPVDFQERFQRWHQMLAWQIHGGGAGVGGLSPRAFLAVETACREFIKAVVPVAFKKVSVELHMHQAKPEFFDYLDFIVKKVETLAYIDAALQSIGRPGKFAA